MLNVVDTRSVIVVPDKKRAQHLGRLCEMHHVLGIAVAVQHIVRTVEDCFREFFSVNLVTALQTALLYARIRLERDAQQFKICMIGGRLLVNFLQVVLYVLQSELKILLLG